MVLGFLIINFQPLVRNSFPKAEAVWYLSPRKMNRSKIPPPSKIEITESLVLEGDIAEVLPRLPDLSVQCIITSPPYWGLRDYGIHGQIGLEPTLAAYIHTLTSVVAAMRRILKPDGLVWLNMVDGCTSGT